MLCSSASWMISHREREAFTMSMLMTAIALVLIYVSTKLTAKSHEH